MLISKISKIKLVKAWKRALKIDIQYLFETDKIDHINYFQDEKTGLRYFEPAVVGDSYFYEQLAQYPWYYSEDKLEYTYAKKFTKNKSVLEVGCGKGAFSSLCNASEYVGLEINKLAIEHLNEKGIKGYEHSLHEHAEQYPANYDVVCSFQVLEHLANPIEYFQNVYKLLKEDGLAIVSVPAEDSFIKIEFWDIMNMPPHHINRFTDCSLNTLASECQLYLEDLIHIPIENFHYIPYLKALIFDRIRRKLNLPEPHLLDERWCIWFVWKLASLLTRCIDTNFDDSDYLLPNGPYILAVYRKFL